jgi:hypothetical protein
MFLANNRQELAAIGVNYPDIDVMIGYGHHRLVEKVRRLEQQQLTDHIGTFLAGEFNVISSENFDRLNRTEIEKLKNSLQSTETTIVFYYRNWFDLLPSWWQEKVKNGATTSFCEFALPHILRPFSSEITNPAFVLDRYSEIFGKDAIKVVDYDQAMEKDDVLQPFLDILGVDVERKKVDFVNKSMKFEEVEVIRALNLTAKGQNRLRAHNVRGAYLRKRGDEKIRGEVECLTREIQSCMKPFRLSGGFFTGAVRTSFRKKYESCSANGFSAGSSGRELLIPSDGWMLQEDARRACEHILDYILA